MNKYKREKGQTVIETALMMIFLLVLLFGIAEVARAWWLKNQLNNAARVAVRVAIVTPGLTSISSANCSAPSGPVVTAACNSITNTSLTNTSVGLTITDNNSNGTVDSGDTVTATVQGTFTSLFPNLTLPNGSRLIDTTIPMSTSASMRYE